MSRIKDLPLLCKITILRTLNLMILGLSCMTFGARKGHAACTCQTYWSSYFPISLKFGTNWKNAMCSVFMCSAAFGRMTLLSNELCRNSTNSLVHQPVVAVQQSTCLADVLLLHLIFRRPVVKISRFVAASAWNDLWFASGDGWKNSLEVSSPLGAWRMN